MCFSGLSIIYGLLMYVVNCCYVDCKDARLLTDLLHHRENTWQHLKFVVLSQNILFLKGQSLYGHTLSVIILQHMQYKIHGWAIRKQNNAFFTDMCLNGSFL